ncbi:MAG: choice-of-anchor L domain-containing protein [Flavobacteriales bacterium]|jgi:gliding motility-associated-like protein|nr:choice-of-anchor L domain-containing protein [Flavobacteriales bacterium]
MKKFVFIFLFFFSFYQGYSQVTTDNTAPYDDVEYLINNVLSDGNANITNITFTTGDYNQIGYFQDQNVAYNTFGFEEGMYMMSRGPAMINSTGGGTAYNNPSPQDGDMTALTQLMFGTNYNAAQHDQNNLAIIEFDLVAGDSFFDFWYVFGSREYNGYTCSGSYNDLFGFFISGPDPNGGNYVGKNIARIPTSMAQNSFTNTPVAINTVNSGVANGAQTNCSNANPNWNTTDSAYFIANYNPNNPNVGPDVNYPVYFDGWTVPLRAYLPVVCDETYHFKLAVCDIADQALGSGVMLLKNSLSSPVSVNFQASPNVTPDTNGYFYEGCGQASIKFSRPNLPKFAPGTGDLRITFDLLGTAVYGQDYVFLNSLSDSDIVIPNHANDFDLIIVPKEDGLVEPVEIATIRVDQLSVGGCDTATWTDFEIKIADHEDILIDLPDEIKVHCPGDEASFEAIISGGLPNVFDPKYTVNWSHIGTAEKQTVYPQETTTYYVEVSDVCPQSVTRDSIRVVVPVYDKLEIDSLDDQFLCLSDARQYNFLENKVRGGDESYTFEWINNENNVVEHIGDNPLMYPGKYTVKVTDGCGNTGRQEVAIYDYELPDQEILYTETKNELEVEFRNLELPINDNVNEMYVKYKWDFGDNTGTFDKNGTFTHKFPAYGKYTITLTTTNKIGCEKTVTRNIDLRPYIFTPNVFTPNGDGENETFKVVTTDQVEEFELRIFNRWGKEVFMTKDPSIEWNGMDKDGKECEVGSYLYKGTLKIYEVEDEKVIDGYILLAK